MVATTSHSATVGADVHTPFFAVYADQAAREGAVGLKNEDVLKLALQQDNNTLWVLTNESPVTWAEVSATAALSFASFVASTALDMGQQQVKNAHMRGMVLGDNEQNVVFGSVNQDLLNDGHYARYYLNGHTTLDFTGEVSEGQFAIVELEKGQASFTLTIAGKACPWMDSQEAYVKMHALCISSGGIWETYPLSKDLPGNALTVGKSVTTPTVGGVTQLDLSVSDTFDVLLDQDITLSMINAPAGMSSITLRLAQDATGGRAVSWGSVVNGTLNLLSKANFDAVNTLVTMDGGANWFIMSSVSKDDPLFWLGGNPGLPTDDNFAGPTGGSVYGIAFDGTHLYTLQQSTGKIFKHENINGAITEVADIGYTNGYGLVHVGGDKFAYIANNDVFVRSLSSGVFSQMNEPYPSDLYRGVAWDGIEYYLINSSKDQIEVWSDIGNGGTLQRTLPYSGGGTSPNSAFFDGTDIIVGDYSNNNIYRVDRTTGVATAIFNDSLAANGAIGFDGTNLLSWAWDTNVIRVHNGFAAYAGL